MSDPSDPSMLAVVDAKQRLLDWGEETDVAWLTQIEEIKATVQSQSRKILPWGVGIAAGVGLLSLLRGKRGGDGGSARSGSSLGLVSKLVRGVRIALPIVAPIIIARLKNEKPRS